jgi:hypothetical protein
MKIDFDALSNIQNELINANNTFEMNWSINKKIEILRTIILEILACYYPNISLPEGNEQFLNSKIESAKVWALCFYRDGLQITGSIIGQLVGGSIVGCLEQMLKQCLDSEIFEQDNDANKLKKKLLTILEQVNQLSNTK